MCTTLRNVKILEKLPSRLQSGDLESLPLISFTEESEHFPHSFSKLTISGAEVCKANFLFILFFAPCAVRHQAQSLGGQRH